MKFKIVTEPDMSAFLSNPQLEAFIRSITEATMSGITEDIMAEFTAILQQAIQRTNETITTRLSNVTESVIEQITSLTNIGGVEINLGVLDFGFGGYGSGGNVDNLGGGGGFGGGRGEAVIADQPTVTINIIDNCKKHHTKHCPSGNDCPCPVFCVTGKRMEWHLSSCGSTGFLDDMEDRIRVKSVLRAFKWK